MGRRGAVNPNDDSEYRRPPATTPQGQENHMINLAMTVAEKRLREGTASAQEITHFLKLGSSREKLEQKRLAGEIELNVAKIQQMASIERVETMYAEAIQAMRRYGGNFAKEPVEDYYDED